MASQKAGLFPTFTSTTYPNPSCFFHTFHIHQHGVGFAFHWHSIGGGQWVLRFLVFIVEIGKTSKVSSSSSNAFTFSVSRDRLLGTEQMDGQTKWICCIIKRDIESVARQQKQQSSQLLTTQSSHLWQYADSILFQVVMSINLQSCHRWRQMARDQLLRMSLDQISHSPHAEEKT